MCPPSDNMGHHKFQPIILVANHNSFTTTIYIITKMSKLRAWVLSNLQTSHNIWIQILTLCFQQIVGGQVDDIPFGDTYVHDISSAHRMTIRHSFSPFMVTFNKIVLQLTWQHTKFNHNGCIFCCAIPSYGFLQHQYQQISPALIPCYMIKSQCDQGETFSVAPTTQTSTKTALNYLYSPDFDKIQLISTWISSGHWHHDDHKVRQVPQIREEPYQLAPFLHFASPVVALHVNDVLLYGVVDTGCATLLCSRGYHQQLFSTTKLHPYTGNKYHQANADELPIVGVLSCSFQIGTLITKENIPIFESPLSHRELLIGWVYLKQNGLTIGPNGLFQYPPNAFQVQLPQADQKAVEGGVLNTAHVMTKQTNIHCSHCEQHCSQDSDDTFICKCDNRQREVNRQDIHYKNAHQKKHPSPPFNVIAAEDVTILPKQQLLLKCRIQNLQEEDLKWFETTYMVFSSENTEPWQSLTKLSIFFQLLPVTATDQIVHLVYFNDNATSVFLYQNDIVGQCEPMHYAGDTEVTQLSKFNPGVFYVGAILQCPQTDEQSLKTPSCSHLELNIDDKYDLDEDDIHIQSTDPAIRSRMTQLIQKYQDIFGKSAWSVCSWGSTFHMEVCPGATPHVAPRIPIPEKIRNTARKIINILLQRGLIVPSKSPWRNSILFLVKKKNPNSPQHDDDDVPVSRVRVVIDFRKTNESLLQTWTSQPLPLIEELLASMHGMKIISTADLTQGFFGCKLSTDCQPLTSFEHEGRLFQWTRLIQGAKPSAQVFNSHVTRLLWDNNLHPEQRKDKDNNYTSGVTNYLDDLAIVSVDQESHFQILQELFEVLRKNKVRLKLVKSTWYIMDKVDFLGYSLDIRQSTLQPSKPLVDKITNLKFPKTKRQIKSALGSFTFFHNLLPNFAEKLAPLFEVLQIDQPFTFGTKQKQAFQWAVNNLAKLPMVYLIDTSKPVYGVTDGAAHNSIAYCLLQYNTKLNSFVPCKWNSHRLNKAQMNYSQIHIETLSLSVYCSENYPLLLYRRSYLFNDSKCLSFLAKFRFQNVALYRLHLLISSCNLFFIWLPSSHSVVTLVDLLTRPPLKKGHQAPLVSKKKLSQELITSLPFVNFDGMPELSYTQVLDLLDNFHDLCDKLGPQNLQEKWQALLNQAILPPPAQQTALVQCLHVNLYFDNRNNNIGRDPFVQYCSRINKFSNKYSYVHNVHNCTQNLSSMVFIDKTVHNDVKYTTQRGNKKQEAVRGKAAKPGGQPRPPLLTSNKLSSFLQAEGKLHCFFPSFQLENLIHEQLQDAKLMTNIQSNPNDYIQIKNVYCKKTTYKGFTYYPICWPFQLNKILLQKSHIVNKMLHLRKDKLFSQLRPFFHIRGYNTAFQNLDCKHCEQNLKARHPKIPHGISFNIRQCRSFISIDCCTVDSSMEYGSFLLCADICSYYLLAFQCKQNPTAADIYQLIFTGWVQTMGIPIGIQADGGLSSQLAHDIASMFNIRQYFISPHNSKSARVELCHRYILANLKGAQQCGFLNDQSFGLWLSLATLLWNSTRNLDGVSPSQLQFNGFNCRTHQFVTLSNLRQQQSRSFLTQQIQEASNFLSMVCYRRKQLNMKKEEELNKYESVIHVGDLVLRQRMETKQARWKLKTKYFPTPYRVVITRPHYCIIMPLQAPIEYISSPFLKGTKMKKKGIRVAQMHLKKIKNPYGYLNLQNGIFHLEEAAKILGTSSPVKQIIIGPPLVPSKTNHPFYRQFAKPPGYSELTGSCTTFAQTTQGSDTQRDMCFLEEPPFIADIHSNRSRIDQFVAAVRTKMSRQKLLSLSLGVLKGDSKYIYILSKNYTWPRSVGQNATCSYRYQTLYGQLRKQHLKNRMDYLRQISSLCGPNDNNSCRGNSCQQQGHMPLTHKNTKSLKFHADDPLENFDVELLNDYLDVCIHYPKSHIFPLVFSQIQQLRTDSMSASSDVSSSHRQKADRQPPALPVASPPTSSTRTSTSGSQSFRSVHSQQERLSSEIEGSDHFDGNGQIGGNGSHKRDLLHSSDADKSSSSSLNSLERRRHSDLSDGEFDRTVVPDPFDGSGEDEDEDEAEGVEGHQGGVPHLPGHAPRHLSIQQPAEVPPIVDSFTKSRKSTSKKSTKSKTETPANPASPSCSHSDQIPAAGAAGPQVKTNSKTTVKTKTRHSVRLKTRK